jgi:hypothetical protein
VSVWKTIVSFSALCRAFHRARQESRSAQTGERSYGIASKYGVRTKPLARRTLPRVRCRRLKRWFELWS